MIVNEINFLAQVLCLFSYGTGLILGKILENRRWKKEAVEAGHAEYYLDGNQAKWRWK